MNADEVIESYKINVVHS